MSLIPIVNPATLWVVQRDLYPDSVEVPLPEVFAWANEHLHDPVRSRYRWRSLALCLQHPGGFFYRLKPGGPLMGYRFGLLPEQYRSGYDCI